MTRRGLLFGLSVLLCAVVIAMVSMPQRACSQDGPIFNPLIFPIIKEVRGKFKEWRAEHKYNPRKLVNAVKEGAKKLEETTALLPVGDQVGLFSIFFEEASKTLDIKDFCRLYFQYRGDEKSKFNRTEFSEKWASDEYYEQNCLKKKKEPSDQALAPCGEGERTIAETAKGNYTIELLGDGTTTDQTVVAVTNNDTGAFGATTVKTMCSSTRTHKPPPYRDVGFKAGLTYSVAAANPAHVAILKAADKLASEGKFSKLGLHNAKEQVAQNAIWTVEGEKTGKPEHQVTNDSIKSRILKQVDPEKVTPEVNQALTTRVDEILACVNLTIKESKPLIQDPPPKKPEDDTVTPPPPETGDDSCEPGEGPEDFCIPPYTAFEPCDDSYQCITTTENENIALCNPGEGVPTGGTTTTDDGDKDDEPGDGVVTTPPEEPAVSEPPEKEKEYGILLTRDDDSWIPENENRTSVTAQIYEKTKGGTWVPSDAKRFITIKFKERSNEKGECLNSGDDKDPDLYFSSDDNPDLTCSDAPDEAGLYFGQATTKKAVSKQKAVVTSRDWGGFSVIYALSKDCIPLKRFCTTPTPKAEDSAIPRYVRGSEHEYSNVKEHSNNLVKVPKDDNDNQIADYYEWRHSHYPTAESDKEYYPVTCADGDGLSAYEEYRGFRIADDRHLRTDWLTKDLFIYDPDMLGFATYMFASKHECHEISEEQFNGTESRIINFNGGHANIIKQHGLWLFDTQLEKGVLGLAGAIGPPRKVPWVKVDRIKHISRGVVRQRFLSITVTHELGHGTGVRHHNDGEDGEEKIIECVNSPPTQHDHLNERLHWLKLPDTFWVGNKGNQMSGDVSCYMLYENRFPAVYLTNGVYEEASARMEYDKFCLSSKGTGENADGRCAGDAVNGNCRYQLIVNDAKKSTWEQ